MPRPPLQIGTWGHIKRTKIADGRWLAIASFRDADGKTRVVRRWTPPNTVDKTGAAAERALVAAMTERSHDATAETVTPDTRLSQLWLLYRVELKRKDRAARTLERYDYVAISINAGLGAVRVCEATTQRVDTYLQTTAEKQGVSVARTARTILSGMMRLAVRYGATDVNPVRETLTFGKGGSSTPKRSFTAEELAALLHDLRTSREPISKDTKTPIAEYAAQYDVADVIVTLAGTGVRISELLGLTWPQVDFEALTITVSGKVVRAPGSGLQRVQPTANADTKNRQRVLPMPDFVATTLLARKVDARPNELDLVFPSSVGTLRDPDNTRKRWRMLRAALGVDWVTPHTFRRTVATLIDDAGMSARVAADQLGHSRTSMTQDVYMSRGRIHPRIADILSTAARR